MLNQQFIRQKNMLPMLPFSAPTLWRMVKAGTFPKPIKLGERITAWHIEEVQAWIDEKIKGELNA